MSLDLWELLLMDEMGIMDSREEQLKKLVEGLRHQLSYSEGPISHEDFQKVCRSCNIDIDSLTQEELDLIERML